MPAPVKKFKATNFEASVWENERDFQNATVSYKTVTLRKTWKDKTNTTRDQHLNLRKQDVEKALVLLRKIQEYLILEGEK
jgi:hypothetical protein